MRKAAKDIVEAHFRALFAADIASGAATLRALRNLEDPEPPRKEADLNRAHLFLQFPPHRETPVCIGGPSASWRERGAFVLYALVASGKADPAADALFERALASIRTRSIGGVVDITGVFGADAGARFGGNWWGNAAAVEYEVEDV